MSAFDVTLLDQNINLLRFCFEAPILRKVEPVGSFFERFCKSGRVRAISTRSDHSLEVEEEANDIDDLEDTDDPNVIPKCDPKDWKVDLRTFLLFSFTKYF